MFITLTDIVTNQQMRINVESITGYVHKKSTNNDYLPLGDCTAVYLRGHEPGVVLVSQSPEQLDTLLGECFITVKAEQK